MNESTTYYTNLITRYFSGEITEDELRLLSDWMKTDPEHEECFIQYQKTWNLIEAQKTHSAINTDLEWNALQAKLKVTKSETEFPVKVISLYQNRKAIKLFLQNTWKVAAAIIILLVSSFFIYYNLSKPANIVVTAKATNIEQLLPDGSVVSLHAGSQITFPAKFASGTRNVQLKGEAYFKVSHDKTKPFIVASGDARIEVLGTEFNINTHTSAGTMEVVLTTGKVSVFYRKKPQDNVVLMPGDKAELIPANKQILKSVNSNHNYMAWKTRVLVFDNETLAQVANTLQNVYQTPVKLADPHLSGCRVTASFKDQSLQSVLQVLKETLNIKVKENGKIIELSGNGCR